VADAVELSSLRAFRRYGFARREIISRWSDIVGSVLAECSLPERLSPPRETPDGESRGGTLYVRVQGSFAAEIQHLEPLIIDRINSYYGYRAVDRLKLRQGPVPPRLRPASRREPELTESQKKFLEETLCRVKDNSLRQALYRLGASLFDPEKAEKPRPKRRFARRGKGALPPD